MLLGLLSPAKQDCEVKLFKYLPTSDNRMYFILHRGEYSRRFITVLDREMLYEIFLEEMRQINCVPLGQKHGGIPEPGALHSARNHW